MIIKFLEIRQEKEFALFLRRNQQDWALHWRRKDQNRQQPQLCGRQVKTLEIRSVCGIFLGFVWFALVLWRSGKANLLCANTPTNTSGGVGSSWRAQTAVSAPHSGNRHLVRRQRTREWLAPGWPTLSSTPVKAPLRRRDSPRVWVGWQRSGRCYSCSASSGHQAPDVSSARCLGSSCISLNPHNSRKCGIPFHKGLGLRKVRQPAQGLIAKRRHDSKLRNICEKKRKRKGMFMWYGFMH